jgi:hypothetical protein
MSTFQVGRMLEPKPDDPFIEGEEDAIKEAWKQSNGDTAAAICVWDEDCNPVALLHADIIWRPEA